MTTTEQALLSLTYPGQAFRQWSETGSENAETSTKRFVKDLIQTGTYRHPQEGWTLAIDTERLDRWVATFQRMRTQGVDVEVVVDHRRDADAVRGYLVDLFRQGEVLFGVHEMIGDDAIALAQRVKNVSILLDRDYRDGRGQSYGEAIVHSSLVQQPVVPGQKRFVPIAASQTPRLIEPLQLEQGETAMDEQTLSQIQQLLGDDITCTATNALSLLQAKVHDLTEHTRQLATEKESLQAQLALAQTAPPAEPNDTSPELNAVVLEQLGRSAERQLGLLVQTGKLSPAARDKAVAAFVGRQGKRRSFALVADSGAHDSLLDQLIEILSANTSIAMGEQTSRQSLSLVREIPTDRPLDHDPTLTESMIAQANR